MFIYKKDGTGDINLEFDGYGDAITLSTLEVYEGINPPHRKFSTRTHADGWTITGEVVEDYFEWVNSFIAYHPEFGIVAGDFEDIVIAESERALNNFLQHHSPDRWDYGDI